MIAAMAESSLELPFTTAMNMAPKTGRLTFDATRQDAATKTSYFDGRRSLCRS